MLFLYYSTVTYIFHKEIVNATSTNRSDQKHMKCNMNLKYTKSTKISTRNQFVVLQSH